MQAQFTAEYGAREREWAGHDMVLRSTSGPSVVVGLRGRGSLLVAEFGRQDRRRRIGAEVDSGDVTASIRASTRDAHVAARGQEMSFPFEQPLREVACHIGFSKQGGPAVFKDLKLRKSK